MVFIIKIMVEITIMMTLTLPKKIRFLQFILSGHCLRESEINL